MSDTFDAAAGVLGAELAQALHAAYAQPPRHYHSVGHAAEVARVAAELGGDRACLLAAWAHDVVHDPTATGNEAASAAWLLDHLDPGDPDAAEAARLVRLTERHDPDPGDLRGEVLCDADLSILGSAPEAYEAYRSAVRREYAHLPDEAWRHGRSAVLRGLLGRERLYRRAEAVDRWDAAARRNLADELDLLGRG